MRRRGQGGDGRGRPARRGGGGGWKVQPGGDSRMRPFNESGGNMILYLESFL